MKNARLTNSERSLWIDNDEGLYMWWRGSRTTTATGMRRMTKRQFINENKAEIDAAIRRVRDAKPRY